MPLLRGITAYVIHAGSGPELQPFDHNHDDNNCYCLAEEAEATFIISLSFFAVVQSIYNGIRNPHTMWIVLETNMDTAGSYIRRQEILHHLHPCPPKDDDPLNAYFINLGNHWVQLPHTGNAITDCDFRIKIFKHCPPHT